MAQLTVNAGHWRKKQLNEFLANCCYRRSLAWLRCALRSRSYHSANNNHDLKSFLASPWALRSAGRVAMLQSWDCAISRFNRAHCVGQNGFSCSWWWFQGYHILFLFFKSDFYIFCWDNFAFLIKERVWLCSKSSFFLFIRARRAECHIPVDRIQWCLKDNQILNKYTKKHNLEVKCIAYWLNRT